MKKAEKILEQLGGNGKLKSMIGINSALATEKGVQFKFKGSKKANTATIELDKEDTYTVKFYKIKGTKFNKVKESYRVQAENLKELFENTTQLRLTL